ncbi:MAG: hypothetical protein KME54_01785 [Tolypothrix brevis GSE-NOS-MK-07-07A]|nr:hypothetical protein [Tolypothrix brevis GSE-NOS-MK-07-07A]
MIRKSGRDVPAERLYDRRNVCTTKCVDNAQFMFFLIILLSKLNLVRDRRI